MSETKHTPGPWIVGKRGMDRTICADHELAFDLAIVHNGGNDAQVEANARLISAAPDLLTYIRFEGGGMGLFDEIGRYCFCPARQRGGKWATNPAHHSTGCTRLNEAIAKAEGR